jgi:uncharacterized protein YecT (DUF1311 family)
VKLALMIAAAAVALIDGGASAAPARASDKKPDCYDRAMTQPEINACAAADAADADRRLNRSYQALLCYLDDEEKERLKAVQRAWLAFRDVDCAYWASGGGSIAPMNRLQCIAMLSNQRAMELDGLPPNTPRDAWVNQCAKKD